MNTKIDSLIVADCQQRWRSHHVTKVFFIIVSTLSCFIATLQGTYVQNKSIVLFPVIIQPLSAFLYRLTEVQHASE